MTGEALKALRAKHKLTQAQAAELAMVTTRRWQHWESGQHPMPAHRIKLLLDAVRRIKPKERT